MASQSPTPQSPPGGDAPSESVARSLALDGPTAAGKSAVGRALAERLGFGFLDTGMMYRACTRAVLAAGIDAEDSEAVIERVRTAGLDVEWPDEPTTPRVLVDGEDVTDGLREPEVEASVSLISRLPEVRDEMVRRQRAVAERSPVVMAGRDIGTRVLTDARAKIFLAASIEVRARRRLAEELAAGRETDLERVIEETARRDGLDQTGKRAIHPEQAAADALILDTDALSIDEVVAGALEAYERANAS
ncbi:MAG: (d)CMP kinase [Chloroflexi bacterium]|nr:(d)CMP kinase [Chloroflexota bacterium]